MPISNSNDPDSAEGGKTGGDIPVKITAPDGGWGWVVCIACMFGNLTVGGVCMSFGIILPALEEYYHEGAGVIALAGSILSGLALLSCPLAAMISNRFGLRFAYIAGSILAGTSLLFSTFSPNIYVFIATYGIMGGMGFGLIVLPISVACNYYFVERRALATGIANTGLSIGSFVFPLASDFLLETFDWKVVVYMYAGVAALSCFFGALVRPLSKEPFEDTNQAQNQKNMAQGDSSRKDWLNCLAFHQNPCDLQHCNAHEIVTKGWLSMGCISLTPMTIPKINGYCIIIPDVIRPNSKRMSNLFIQHMEHQHSQVCQLSNPKCGFFHDYNLTNRRTDDNDITLLLSKTK